MNFESNSPRRAMRSGLPFLLAGLPILLTAGQHFHIANLLGGKAHSGSGLSGYPEADAGSAFPASASGQRQEKRPSSPDLFSNEDTAKRKQRLDALLASTVPVRIDLAERRPIPAANIETGAPSTVASRNARQQAPLAFSTLTSGAYSPNWRNRSKNLTIIDVGNTSVSVATMPHGRTPVTSPKVISDLSIDTAAISPASFAVTPRGGFYHSRRKSGSNSAESSGEESGATLATANGSSDDTGVFGGSRPHGGITRAESNYTWTGATGNTLWSTAGNWAGNVVPNGTSAVVVFNDGGQDKSVLDLSGSGPTVGYPIAGMLLNANSTNYSLSGSQLGFYRASGNPFLTQNGSAAITIANPITWRGQSLILGGDGTGNVTMIGQLTSYYFNGEAALYKVGGSTFTLDTTGGSAANTSLTGFLHVNGGTLQAIDGVIMTTFGTYIGEAATDQGQFIVSGHGPVHSERGITSWTDGTTANVGYSGTGRLTIAQGANAKLYTLTIGANAGSTGIVQVTDASSLLQIIANPDVSYVGYSGTGSLSVLNGATLNAGNLSLGYAPGSSGTLTLDGNGTMASLTSLNVGHLGNSATVNISNGARLTSNATYIGGVTVTGIGSGSDTSSVNVDGAGSSLTAPIQQTSMLYIGLDKAGMLTISHGAAVGASNLYCGGATGSRGTGTIDISTGGTLNTQVGYIGYGNGSTGTITVRDSGSTWVSNGTIYMGQGVPPTAGDALNIQNGGTVTAKSSLVCQPGTALNITSGGAFTTGTATIYGSFQNAKFSPLINVTGAGSMLTTGNMLLGNANGGAQLTIQSGGTAKVQSLVASGTTINGTQGLPGLPAAVSVDGSGSTLTSQNALTFGSYTSPTSFNASKLTLTNGGVATAGTTTTIAGASYLIANNGTLNTGTLSGAGTIELDGNFTLNQSGNSTFSGVIVDGVATSGIFTKSGAGTLSLTGTGTYAAGTLIAGGTLAAGGSALGTGNVLVSGGATLGVGEAVNTSGSAQATGSLSISSLTLASGSATPQLTFNLGNGGVSDVLNLTGTNTELTFSGAGDINIGFASATGLPLGDGTFTLMTFATPETPGSAPALSQFHAVAAGNLGSLNSNYAFAYQLTNGNITALTFTLSSADTPEPDAAALMLTVLPILGAALRFGGYRKRREKSSVVS